MTDIARAWLESAITSATSPLAPEERNPTQLVVPMALKSVDAPVTEKQPINSSPAPDTVTDPVDQLLAALPLLMVAPLEVKESSGVRCTPEYSATVAFRYGATPEEDGVIVSVHAPPDTFFAYQIDAVLLPPLLMAYCEFTCV